MIGLVKLSNRLLSRVRPNRAADPVMLSAYDRATSFFACHWTGKWAEGWNLQTLGVLPNCQMNGIGRELVMWGLQRADKDGLPASVVCSAGSETFYRKCGFLTRVGNVCEGAGNPLAGIRGGEILFKDAY